MNVRAQTKEDSLAIKKVCRDYVEGWVEGKPGRVANSVSEKMLKRTIKMDMNDRCQIIHISAAQDISWTERNKEEGKVTRVRDREPEKELKNLAAQLYGESVRTTTEVRIWKNHFTFRAICAILRIPNPTLNEDSYM
jgi:hypothetical protein